jgi:hypothetical protein
MTGVKDQYKILKDVGKGAENNLSEKGKRMIKSRMTGGDSTGILFPNVYKVKNKKEKTK